MLVVELMSVAKNFNPHSRGERLCLYNIFKIMQEISIHVPAWGTTFPLPLPGTRTAISIHVPTWGTTQFFTKIIRYVHISIHVPAWGTTLINASAFFLSLFQSTFPHGERREVELQLVICKKFQSTFPHGERQVAFVLCIFVHFYFNPRSRMGNDHIWICDFNVLWVISIHVPAWGTTAILAQNYFLF